MNRIFIDEAVGASMKLGVGESKLERGPSRPARQSRVRLRDIALAAGVSVATASRALAKPHMVSESVRKTIEQVCRDLTYIPSHAARVLSLDRSGVVGVIVPTISNPLFAPTVDGIRESLDKAGLGLLMNSCERDAVREYEQCRGLIEHGVDAILLLHPVHTPGLFELLNSFGIPFVCMDTQAGSKDFPSVTFDHAFAMSLAVDHVISNGHSDIAVLSGPRSTSPVIADRIDGALRALTRAGLAPPAEWMVECEYDGVSAREGARSLLNRRDQPTAIVCTGDLHGLAAIIESKAHGLSVPRDISVTGCNDMPIAMFSDPPLTTVRTPYRELGVRAAAQILHLLNSEAIDELISCDVELVERASVAKPPSVRGGFPRSRSQLRGEDSQFRNHEF